MTTRDWPFDQEALASLAYPPNPRERWSVAFWWISTAPGSLELLYGWCVARPGNVAPRWSSAECDAVRGEVADRDVERSVVDGPGDLIFAFVAALARGETLGRAASTAGLPAPPTRFIDCRLGETSAGGAELVRTPWMLLDTASDAGAREAHDRGPESPSGEVPCLLRSLERRDLSTLLAGNAGIDRTLVAAAAARLTKETGLAFGGSWFGRIGAFDVLAFPAAFPDEAPRVDVRVHGRSAIAVSVALEGLERVEQLIVRCRQRTKGVTLSDELQTVAVPTSEPGVIEVIFPGPEGGPYATRVEAWLREIESGRCRLLFAHTFYWIRQIQLGMNILGGGASIRAPWLETFTRSRATRLRAQAMTTRVRFSGDPKVVVGDPLPTFERVAARRRELRQQTFPSPSGTRFFTVGHGANSSRLAIAEWLVDVVATGAVGIVVVDPYFDEWGLELVARAKETDVEWVVVTCLQQRKGGGKGAEDRLRASWAQLAPLLESRRIQVIELGSSGTDALFHDRYVLKVDADGVPQKGFHLSNSLQAAAVNHPLLVTPIGDDVLKDVHGYVSDLLNVPDKTEAAPNASFKCIIVGSSKPKAPETPDVPPAENVETLVARVLATESDETFARDWAALSSALAHTAGDPPLDGIADRGGGALAERLESLIASSPRDKLPQGTLGSPARNESIALLQFAAKPFAEVIRDAGNYLQYWYGPLGGPWPLLYATRILAKLDSTRLVRAADRIVAGAPPNDRPLPDQSPSAEAFCHAFGTIAHHLGREGRPAALSDPLLTAVAHSTVPLLRAALSASLSRSVRSEPTRVNAVDLLQDPEERLLAMAAWVYELRVDANRAGRKESKELLDARSTIFSRMKTDWQTRDPENLRRILRLLSGPLEGTWAQSTVSELLHPLVEEGKQSRGAIDRTFAAMVNERIVGIADGQHHFYYDTDAELTEVTATLLASSPLANDEVQAVVAPTQRAVARAVRLLARPFLRSTNYNSWSGAREAITWATTYGRLMSLHGARSSVLVECSTEWIGAWEALERTERDPLMIADQRNLGAFARAVEEAARDQSSTKSR